MQIRSSFDKTGTLTKATPTVKDVVVFGEYPKEEALRIAACLEEHFPHSMAKAVARCSKGTQSSHEEMHSKVEYYRGTWNFFLYNVKKL